MSEASERSNIGTVSLWAGILGIILPIVAAFLIRRFVKVNDEGYYLLCWLFFAGAELIALITGIVGRKSPAGKAGLGISLTCVILMVLAIPFLLCREAAPHSALEEPQQIIQVDSE